MSKSIFLVLGDQLFSSRNRGFKKDQAVLMIEDQGLCTHFKYHKNKILLFLSSMRSYRDQLKSKEHKVFYYDSSHKLFSKKFEAKLEDFFSNNKSFNALETYDVSDHFFKNRLTKFCQKRKIELNFIDNPMFLTTRDQFSKYIEKSKKPFMMTFYSEQRQRLGLLLDDDQKPVGGKWSFDAENRKKYPKKN